MNRWKDWVGLAARLILGGAILVAGLLKIGNLQQSVLSTRAYQILPWDIAAYVGYGLPVFEIILGILLISGLLTRWTGLTGALLMAVFIAAIISVWSRGINIDCGCFGGGGEVGASDTKYPEEIARDLGLMALGIWLVVRPYTPFALDNWLFKPIELEEDE